MNAMARASTPADRLHDALVSLRFLVEVDVMAQFLDQVCLPLFFTLLLTPHSIKDLKQTIAAFYDFLLPLLPEVSLRSSPSV
jgi:hypothetical protein